MVICKASFPQHCNSAFGTASFLSENIVSKAALSNGGPCGNFEGGHVQVGERVIVCLSPPPLPPPTLLIHKHVLFMCFCTLFSFIYIVDIFKEFKIFYSRKKYSI